MAQDLIQGNLNRSQVEEKMANLQFHDTRNLPPGGDRNSPPRRLATLEEPEEPKEQAQEETSGRHAAIGHQAEHTNMEYKKI